VALVEQVLEQSLRHGGGSIRILGRPGENAPFLLEIDVFSHP
jgi:hypothetical protein